MGIAGGKNYLSFEVYSEELMEKEWYYYYPDSSTIFDSNFKKIIGFPELKQLRKSNKLDVDTLLVICELIVMAYKKGQKEALSKMQNKICDMLGSIFDEEE